MIELPCAKINLGLNITEKRLDGYHNLETVFFPIPLHDTLEVHTMHELFPSNVNCDLKVTGNGVCCNEEDNLIIRAYNLLAQDYKLPRVHAHLYKHIPTEAGLGGGSRDAAFMIRLLNDKYKLNINRATMEIYASQLGADCAFFIASEPAYAEGIGEKLSPITIAENNLYGYCIVVVKPPLAISTKEAFAYIHPQKPSVSCREIVAQPIETWRNLLTNDFEDSIFPNHPKLADIKEKLYDMGAVYAQMSGSGSSLFGIFKGQVTESIFKEQFTDCQVFVLNILQM